VWVYQYEVEDADDVQNLLDEVKKCKWCYSQFSRGNTEKPVVYRIKFPKRCFGLVSVMGIQTEREFKASIAQDISR